jgi:acetyltransferase-like isoleucine patch superfamily enzyme
MVKTKYMKIIRLLLLPIGFIKGIVELSNNKARDIENKKRFPDATIYKSCSFTPGCKIGKNATVMDNCIVNNANIGKYSYINRNTLIQNATIGNYCSIANDVMIGLGAHPLDMISTSPVFYRVHNPLNVTVVKQNSDFIEYKHINVGNDVWIGAKALIMDGVTIGDGAVIAAGAVVTKDVPAYAIVGGTPAKLIKYRQDEKNIAEISKTQWWLEDAEEVFKRHNLYINKANPA